MLGCVLHDASFGADQHHPSDDLGFHAMPLPRSTGHFLSSLHDDGVHRRFELASSFLGFSKPSRHHNFDDYIRTKQFSAFAGSDKADDKDGGNNQPPSPKPGKVEPDQAIQKVKYAEEKNKT